MQKADHCPNTALDFAGKLREAVSHRVGLLKSRVLANVFATHSLLSRHLLQRARYRSGS